MFDFGSDVGIEFAEAASGHVASGISDPQTGERTGKFRGSSFQFSLQVSIPRLDAFLSSTDHVAEIRGGSVSWKPLATGAAVLPGGRLTLYRKAAGSRTHKFVDFAFSFAAAGRTYSCAGLKDLQDDNGLDASTDLSTISLTLQADGQLAGAGIARSNLIDFVRQLQSCKVTGAKSDSEADAARAAFLGFLNGELREVYPTLPLLFRDSTRFSPEQRRTLDLLARLLLPANLPANGPQIEDVSAALDRFLANASASLLTTITNWLQAIGTFIPDTEADPKLLRLLITAQLNSTERSPIRDVLTLLHTLVVFPYYSHPKADALVGYTRPVHQPRNTPDLPVLAEPPDKVWGFAIAGSGPAGTLLAQRLSAAGKSVLLLEAGPYIPERTMDADELLGTARLYKSSGLQQANAGTPLAGLEGPTLTVLQGACLGGGGIINNAVCFRLPAPRLAHWQSLGFPVAAADLSAAYAQVAQELRIKPVSEAANPSPRQNPTWKFLADKLGPVRKPPTDEPPAPGLYECLVNLEDCLGTGLCNVGCGSERKRNGVQVYLRQAAAAGCTIVDHAEVQGVRVDAKSPADGRRVDSLDVRLRGGRRISVKAKEFILSCGPIGSSVVLLKSDGVKADLERNRVPVGQRFSANLGSPIFAFCNEPVNQQPGVQIAHYYFAPPDDGFVIETWFNPPGANSIAVPGFQQAHFDRMMAYARTVAASPLVGSEAAGRVSLDWQGAPVVELPISSQDLGRLRRGLLVLGGAFLAGKVESAVVGLGNGRALRTDEDLAQLDRDLQEIEKDPGKAYLLKIGTGHPQGGNAMCADPQIGVVDAQFRVRGFRNLRVCDGSIFPESAGVNPQWTIMALADLCGRVATTS
jgi:choline dehydrogenase-like flavoprotein